MEILAHFPWWIWLMVSLIPYTIERQKTPNMQSLRLSALGWQFSLKYQKKQYCWSISIPWLNQVQSTRDFRMIVISMWTKLVHEWMKKVTTLWE